MAFTYCYKSDKIMDEYGVTMQEFELEMIKFRLMRLNPDKSYDEIEMLAIEELKEIYADE